MQVLNVHQRRLPASAERLAPLIDRLASREDVLWPGANWPPMRFDRPLSVGARGGHGPIRYEVEAYIPGRSVRFRFSRPRDFDGTHGFVLETDGEGAARLTHRIEMNVSGFSLVQWGLVFRPMHDALLEDCLDRAEQFAGGSPAARPWSPWVRVLRNLLRGKRKPR